jgi:hypothetical protein
MKTKHAHAPNAERLTELRRREEEVAKSPSPENYLKLADEYHALNMGKESDRLAQLAEALENGAVRGNGSGSHGYLSGAANPTMLTEVVQILSRTGSSGDFVIETPAQTFHLYFVQGRIINAISQLYRPGLESFRKALRVSAGTYHFVQKTVHGIEPLLSETTEILLLNAMDEADKEAAGHVNL